MNLPPQDGLLGALDALGLPFLLRGPDGRVLHASPEARSLGELEPERRSVPLEGGARLELLIPSARRTRVLEIALHDLRAPLANVRTYAQLLMRGTLAPGDEKVRRSGEVIARNADRALRLLTEFLDSELAEVGALSLHLEALELTGLVREIAEARRAEISERGLTLSLELPLQPLVLDGDVGRLHQLIDTLFDEVLRRAPANTEVILRCQPEPGQISLALIDQGPSLDATALFERDAQAVRDRHLSPAAGLAVARALARAHGGSLSARTEPQGTSWLLTLPSPRH